jgi:hypothetical protein
MSADDGPGAREIAYRPLAAEFDDATLSYSESDEERAPNYVVTPTGLRINRLFAVGVLTEVEAVNDDVLRGRVVDPTGAFVTYAGQYQPEAAAFLDRTQPPEFVALTGKARTFEPEDADVTYTSVRPESINAVDADTRDRWVVSAAESTLRRVALVADALAMDARGDDLREELLAAGVPESLAAGIPRAIEHYGTTRAYLEAVRRTAVDALELVADERDSVRSIDVAPDEGGDVELGPLPQDVGEVALASTAGTADSAEATGSADSAAVTETPETTAAADTADTQATAETADTAETTPTPETAETTEATKTAETTETAGATKTAETTETAGSPGTDGTTASAEASSESVTETAGAADSTDRSGASVESPDDFDADDAGGLGDFDVDDSGGGDAFDEGGSDDLGDFGSGASDDPDAGASGIETPGAGADDDATGAHAASSDESAGDSVAEGEMYEFDEEERQEIEEEFGTEFTSGAEVDAPGEADIDVPDADAGDETEADAAPGEVDPDSAAVESGAEGAAPASEDPPAGAQTGDGTAEETGAADAGTATEVAAEHPADEGSDAPAADEGSDALAAEDVDVESEAVKTMDELDDGDGAEREVVVETVVEEYGVPAEDVEDAIESALLSGRCYEPQEDRLKAI